MTPVLSPDSPTVLVITGPTGSGKTETALKVAERIPSEIILLDLRLSCPGLNILGAGPGLDASGAAPQLRLPCPEEGELDPFAAAKGAQELTREVRARGRLPIWTAGPQLLLAAALGSLRELPEPDPDLRARLAKVLDRRGPERLHRMLKRLDPAAALRFGPKDSPRILRALELALRGAAVPPFPEFHRPGPVWNGWRFLMVSLEPRAEGVKERLASRLHVMVERGALDEVRSLDRALAPGHGARTAHGFPHLLRVLEGSESLDQALEKAATDTSHYVRRQRNFLRRIEGLTRLEGRDAEPFRAAESILQSLSSLAAA